MKNFYLIEFLKGYSIFTIIVYHYLGELSLSPFMGSLISFGGTGVHLFIFLSGFGLYLSQRNKPLGYLAFLRRRFTKVYLPYILVVLISASISLNIPVFDNSLYAISGHIFLFKMFDQSIIGSYGYQLWFVSTILQFYFTFHLFIKALDAVGENKFLIIGLCISLAWAAAVAYLGYASVRVWNSFFLQYLWEFALGMIIAAKLKKNNFEIKNLPSNWTFLLAGILLCVIYGALALVPGGTGKLFNDIPALLGFGALACWLFRLKVSFVNSFFLFTGNISYTLFLIHILVLKTTLYVLDFFPIAIVLIVSLILTFLFAVGLNPILNSLFKILEPRRTAKIPAEEQALVSHKID